jgi:hypothetical protein
MICYKDREFDSEREADLVSTYWKDVGLPSNTLTGVYGDNEWTDVSVARRFFVVQDDSHWG